MLHKNGNIIQKVAIPPYRPFEWKLSEMKQKGICQSIMTIISQVVFSTVMEHKLKIENLKSKNLSVAWIGRKAG